MRVLSQDCKFAVHSNAIAAGAADVSTLTGVDTAGYDGICFLIQFGAIVTGAATGVKAQSSSGAADGTGDAFADIAGTLITVTDDQDSKIVYMDIVNPPERWVRCFIARATQNSTIESIVAILYNTHNPEPVTHDTTVSTLSETTIAPANGTA